jgi:hypothetical protein
MIKRAIWLCSIMVLLLMGCQPEDDPAVKLVEGQVFTSDSQLPRYSNEQVENYFYASSYQLPDQGDTFAELSTHADVVVTGRITQKKYFIYSGIPATEVTIQVDQVFKGNPPDQLRTVAMGPPISTKQAKAQAERLYMAEGGLLYNPLAYAPFGEELLFLGRHVEKDAGIPGEDVYATVGMYKGVYGVKPDGSLYDLATLVGRDMRVWPVVKDTLEFVQNLQGVQAALGQ